MVSLKQARAIIFKTECRKHIREGLECSEPILTKGEYGLIDNYFIYGCDGESKHFTKPLAGFGVYTEIEKTAYFDKSFDLEDKDYVSLCEIDINQSFEAFDKYSETYPKIREFAYKKCNKDEIEILKIYIENLRIFSGDALYSFYEKLYPEFFEWVYKEIEQ